MKKPYLMAIGAFLISGALLSYAILQSRGSTSVIGFIFVPLFSILPAGIAYALAISRKGWPRALLGIGLILLLGFHFRIIATTMRHTEQRDLDARYRAALYSQAHMIVEGKVRAHPGAESQALREMLAGSPSREMILAIVDDPRCPPDYLARFGRSDDMGIVLAVARNPSTPPDTLESIFRAPRYPSFYFSTLSRNPATPVTILRELYLRRKENRLIAPNLSTNPSTPADIRKQLNSAQTGE